MVKDLEGPSLGSGSDTVYFAVVDADGDACLFINRIYQVFGFGLVPEGCGFALHVSNCARWLHVTTTATCYFALEQVPVTF